MLAELSYNDLIYFNHIIRPDNPYPYISFITAYIIMPRLYHSLSRKDFFNDRKGLEVNSTRYSPTSWPTWKFRFKMKKKKIVKIYKLSHFQTFVKIHSLCKKKKIIKTKKNVLIRGFRSFLFDCKIIITIVIYHI